MFTAELFSAVNNLSYPSPTSLYYLIASLCKAVDRPSLMRETKPPLQFFHIFPFMKEK